MCGPCQQRRESNRKWHNKPDVKPRRLQANRDRKRNWLKFCRKCGADISKSELFERLCEKCRPASKSFRVSIQIPDSELDRRALENWPAEWGKR
jgi:hypothetical protein